MTERQRLPRLYTSSIFSAPVPALTSRLSGKIRCEQAVMSCPFSPVRVMPNASLQSHPPKLYSGPSGTPSCARGTTLSLRTISPRWVRL